MNAGFSNLLNTTQSQIYLTLAGCWPCMSIDTFRIRNTQMYAWRVTYPKDKVWKRMIAGRTIRKYCEWCASTAILVPVKKIKENKNKSNI